MPQALADFEMGMKEAFLVSFAVTLIAAVVSFLRPHFDRSTSLSVLNTDINENNRELN